MKKIKELMRLKWECGCSNRAIARSLNVSDSTIGDCIQRIKAAGLEWPLPDDLAEEALEEKLYSKITGTMDKHHC